jgi:CRP-like cAMP-binding protein
MGTTLGDQPAHRAFIGRLEGATPLTAAERGALLSVPIKIRKTAAREEIVPDGEQVGAVHLLLDGLACRHKVLPDGARQIISFHFPGEAPDLEALYTGTLDCGLGAVTDVRVAQVAHGPLAAACQAYPRLTTLIWRHILLDAGICREWLVGLGRRSARSRMAHLLCEVVARAQRLGLVSRGRCLFPVTQAELADALGLTPVHVSRVLRDMSLAGYATFTRGRLEVHDWTRLQAAADFDQRYLSPACQAA